MAEEDIEVLYRRRYRSQLDEIARLPARCHGPLRKSDLPHTAVLQGDEAPAVGHFADIKSIGEHDVVAVPGAAGKLGRSGLTLSRGAMEGEQEEYCSER